MANALLVLGQLFPTANTATKLYTVPGSTTAVASSIVVCNQSATADTYTIAIRVGGAADNAKDKLYFGVTIAGNDTFIATIGISLATTDEVWVTSKNGTCSFNLFGQQNT